MAVFVCGVAKHSAKYMGFLWARGPMWLSRGCQSHISKAYPSQRRGKGIISVSLVKFTSPSSLLLPIYVLPGCEPLPRGCCCVREKLPSAWFTGRGSRDERGGRGAFRSDVRVGEGMETMPGGGVDELGNLWLPRSVIQLLSPSESHFSPW